MSTMLETTVSSALLRWRLIERALHGADDWAMRYGDVEVPVTVTRLPSGVEFTADFSPMCRIGGPITEVHLMVDGDLIRVFSLDDPLPESGGVVSYALLVDPVRT